jgi:hypothetical protein
MDEQFGQMSAQASGKAMGYRQSAPKLGDLTRLEKFVNLGEVNYERKTR